jgi:hypothetical protein
MRPPSTDLYLIVLAIASKLPPGKMQAFLVPPKPDMTHAEWMVVRAELYQALSIAQHEKAALELLRPFDQALSQCSARTAPYHVLFQQVLRKFRDTEAKQAIRVI